ncbi:beta-glucosidase [Massilia sp. WF1]|uniref:GH1 family beta-glucosidase n=1 Tax=unclassified Massilia TaxID=2609279 RepID=UPI00064937F4|nr:MULTISPECIES: GH1 family beta-glucosidase [unclassified Massilia]ALK97461.1 beta-glucosidase [Massilia sp. WG5]KLU36643.1 beta-glucosidase [Massilia sp. WF1]
MSTPTRPDPQAPQRADFAADFLWGCATSSYQIEGAAREDGRVESIWDRFAATPGRIKDGSSGEVACDHYHRWPEDLDIARALGLNAYRFSIAWPRIFSEVGGKPNQKGLDFYSRLVDGMLERGLQPWATLYHWDLPQYLQDRGGWNERATVDAFVELADAMTRTLGDRVKHWITHNEPWCTAIIGNFEGWHAPGLTDFKTALQVSHHVLLSHGKSVPVIRANVPDARVGISLSLHPLRPASPNPRDIAAMERHDGLRYRWFLDPLYGRGYPRKILELVGDQAPVVLPGDLDAIAARTDFLGVNYYFPETIADEPGHAPLDARVLPPSGTDITGMGWPVEPQGLAELLARVDRDYHPGPLYVTENGSCYDDTVGPDGSVHDTERRDYLVRHLGALRDAVRDGVPVQGYFAWSLVDNFEWAEGYRKRFGLVHIDYATQQRRLKDSAHWYRSFLE